MRLAGLGWVCKERALRGGKVGGDEVVVVVDVAESGCCKSEEVEGFRRGKGGGVPLALWWWLLLLWRDAVEAGVLGRLGWGEMVGCSGRKACVAEATLVGDALSISSFCLLLLLFNAEEDVESERVEEEAGEGWRGGKEGFDLGLGGGAGRGLSVSLVVEEDEASASNCRMRSFTLSGRDSSSSTSGAIVWKVDGDEQPFAFGFEQGSGAVVVYIAIAKRCVVTVG